MNKSSVSSESQSTSSVSLRSVWLLATEIVLYAGTLGLSATQEHVDNSMWQGGYLLALITVGFLPIFMVTQVFAMRSAMKFLRRTHSQSSMVRFYVLPLVVVCATALLALLLGKQDGLFDAIVVVIIFAPAAICSLFYLIPYIVRGR